MECDARGEFRRSPGRSVLISGDTHSVLVKRDVTEPTQPCLPGCTACVSGIGAGGGGWCLCKCGHLSCSQGLINNRRSLLGDQSHPLGGCCLKLVARSVSPLIPFVICQAGMSEAHSDPARCTFFLPSLVTTFANFRRSAHLAGLQPLA